MTAVRPEGYANQARDCQWKNGIVGSRVEERPWEEASPACGTEQSYGNQRAPADRGGSRKRRWRMTAERLILVGELQH